MNRVRTALVLIILAGVAAPSAWALVSNSNGMVFRAVGIFQGEVEAGRCQVPIANSAIADAAAGICRDFTTLDAGGGSTVVIPTTMYPDSRSLISFCNGYLQVQNNLINQAINIRKIRIRYKIPGQGFPVLCRKERKFNLFVGGRVDPVNGVNLNPFGQINVAFIQMIPIYSAPMLDCLRDPARGDVAAPVTVVAKIRAFGRLDDGRRIKSNRVQYSLTLLPCP